MFAFACLHGFLGLVSLGKTTIVDTNQRDEEKICCESVAAALVVLFIGRVRADRLSLWPVRSSRGKDKDGVVFHLLFVFFGVFTYLSRPPGHDEDFYVLCGVSGGSEGGEGRLRIPGCLFAEMGGKRVMLAFAFVF